MSRGQFTNHIPISTITTATAPQLLWEGGGDTGAIPFLSFYLKIISSLQKMGEFHQSPLRSPVPLQGLPLSHWSLRSPRTALP